MLNVDEYVIFILFFIWLYIKYIYTNITHVPSYTLVSIKKYIIPEYHLHKHFDFFCTISETAQNRMRNQIKCLRKMTKKMKEKESKCRHYENPNETLHLCIH